MPFQWDFGNITIISGNTLPPKIKCFVSDFFFFFNFKTIYLHLYSKRVGKMQKWPRIQNPHFLLNCILICWSVKMTKSSSAVYWSELYKARFQVLIICWSFDFDPFLCPYVLVYFKWSGLFNCSIIITVL